MEDIYAASCTKVKTFMQRNAYMTICSGQFY